MNGQLVYSAADLGGYLACPFTVGCSTTWAALHTFVGNRRDQPEGRIGFAGGISEFASCSGLSLVKAFANKDPCGFSSETESQSGLHEPARVAASLDQQLGQRAKPYS